MRRAARRDANHAPVRDALRAAGILVCDTGGVGGGFPDLVALHATRRDEDGKSWPVMLEVKDGDKVASARKLTPAQVKFTRMWPVVVVKNVQEALRACGVEIAPS